MFNLEKIEYIDIHSHLNFKDYKDDLVNVINRMKENKVGTICIGTDVEESREARKLSEENENILYSVALHPHDNLSEFEEAFENQEKYFDELREIASSKKCVAIGECGLDYFYLKPPQNDYSQLPLSEGEQNTIEQIKEKQKEIFKRHIELAVELNLSLMLHIRPSELEDDKEDAYLDAIEILKKYENLKGNFHFFVGTKNVLENILNSLPNFTVSIPAVCTFTNEYDEMIKNIPPEKIHIETDSPFVMPKSRRGEAKRNEPSFVIDVFNKICEIKNIKNREEFKNILKENFKKMFLNSA